jgi:hypothetical protein
LPPAPFDAAALDSGRDDADAPVSATIFGKRTSQPVARLITIHASGAGEDWRSGRGYRAAPALFRGLEDRLARVAYGARRVALTGFLASPGALAGQRRIWAEAAKEQRRCASCDSLGHFGRQLIDLQVELDGDRGETRLSIETKPRLGEIGALVPSARNGDRILAHRTFSKKGNPQRIPR